MGLLLHTLPPAELVVHAIESDVAVSALPPGQAGLAATVSVAAVPILPAGELAVVAGPFVAGVPAVEPGLLSFHYAFGGKNAYFTVNAWEPLGRIRYRCYDVLGGVYVYSDWSSVGTVDSSMSCAGTMVVGQAYQLQWLLECIPAVPGWDNTAWHVFSPQIEWVQPDRFAPPVDGDWVKSAT